MADATTGSYFEGYSTNALRDALRLLLRAHVLLLNPSSWTRKHWAVDIDGEEVHADSAFAVRWCAGGAVLRAHEQLPGSSAAIHIPIDPATGEAVKVTSPKRAVVALELLGHFLLTANGERIMNLKREKRQALASQHPTLLAADINDLTQIEHPHVLLGVVVAIVATHEELKARRRKSRETQERSVEA